MIDRQGNPQADIVETLERAEIIDDGFPADLVEHVAVEAAATGGAPPSADDTAAHWNVYRGERPLTDLGNAERFYFRNHARFRWCAAIGWLHWDGRRWNADGAEGRVRQAAYDTARGIQDEAKQIRGTDRDLVVGEKKGEPVLYSDRLAAWGRASESAQHLSAITKLVQPKLEVQPRELDADPWKITVDNCTLVIRRDHVGDYVTARPHDPADLITKLAPVVYDPDATCPIYDAFLAFVQPHEPVRRFLHQWGGLSLTGDVSEQKLAFFYGRGKNGKSTLVDAWGHVAGDYGETVPIETFLDQGRGRNAGQATPDLALLPGVRYLRTSEPEKDAKLAEALIKLVTGGEPIQARRLNRDYFKFYPHFKLTMSGNYRPSVGGTDEGIWRRVMLVPWNVTVPDDRRDRALGDKLRGESSGILNRLLDGLRDWLDGGLLVPQDVADATEAYRTDSDPLGRFLVTCVRAVPGGRVQSSELFKVYVAWARATGAREWTPQGFGRAMRERGYRSKEISVVWWVDIVVIKAPGDFIDVDGRPLTRPPEDADDA